MRNIATLPPIFQDAASDGLYLILQNRTPVVLIGGATTATPAAAIIPLDSNFAARADAALRLWQTIAKRSVGRSSDSLTPVRRRRLTLVLRALDAYLAGETYRVIAQGLFGERRVAVGCLLENTRPPGPNDPVGPYRPGPDAWWLPQTS